MLTDNPILKPLRVPLVAEQVLLLHYPKAVVKKKKKLRPCTADCDQRIWKHCTKDCKCDHDYPAVQRFCNPPPMPLFLETCRLWYNQCPRYEQYHYASQFVYSKAEKGKVLPGSTINAAEAKALQNARGR
uniref:CFEM domain-containing protein n=1 Tax=Panagrellus redivivus TaxID=6233 RepID=A0A7E4VLH8_PANRE